MYRIAGGIGRKTLAPTGGVVTVAAMSWTGERSMAQVSSRMINNVSSKRLIKNLRSQHQHRHHQRNQFSSSTPPTSKKKAGSFVDWYEGHLQSRPVATKMCTGCILWGVGDAVAQLVPQLAFPKNDDDTTQKDNNDFEYDVVRTGRACLFGFALHAPTSHVHFNFLEWLTNRVGVTGLGIPIFKTFMEQFVYWGWISNAMYLGAMGAMQGHTTTEVYQKIHDSLWGLMKAQWAFWLPVQALNFQFVPVRHQLNVVLVISIVWTALLSFWYPPQPKPSPKQLEDGS